MATTVVKIKPNATPARQTVLSLEEYIDLQNRNVELVHEIDGTILNATRTMEVVEALEELAVVADNISNATQAEASLIEIGGNIAVAGTELDPSQVIPSLESYIGGKISLEDFDFKGKLQKIWETIKKVWATIWQKIEEFFKNSSVLVGVSVNRIRKLELAVKDNAGKVARAERMELDVNKFKQILNDGEKVITDSTKIISLLDDTINLYSYFFESYVKRLERLGNSLADKIKSINKQNLEASANDITVLLKTEVPALFNTVKSSLLMNASNKPSNITGQSNTENALDVKQFHSNILGSPIFTLTLPDNSLLSDAKDYIDRSRVSKIRIESVPTDDIKNARDLDIPYSQKDMETIVGKTFDLLKEVKYFKDRGLETKVKETRKKVEQATKNLIDQVDNLTAEDTQLINSIMSLNIAFVNWTRYPLIDLVSYSLKIERTISWLIRENLNFYEKGKKQDNNKNQKK